MYAGIEDFPGLGIWLSGYYARYCHTVQAEENELSLFQQWLQTRCDAPGNLDWIGMLEWKFGGGPGTKAKFFELLDTYVLELNELWPENIKSSHEAYLKNKFNNPE